MEIKSLCEFPQTATADSDLGLERVADLLLFWTVNLALVKCTPQIRGYQVMTRLFQLFLMNLRPSPKQQQIYTAAGGLRKMPYPSQYIVILAFQKWKTMHF